MITIYIKDGCPFCERVMAIAAELGIPLKEKNILDDTVAAELIARGGKRQVPYLVDLERGVEMYESGDIAEYLRTHYAR
ncbi:MAG: glutathione S-transferase N-terminal domain-containing protein [Minisyncoccia bacterium]